MSLVVPDVSDFFNVINNALTSTRGQQEGAQGRLDVFRPKTDVLENENEVTILTELPGLNKDQVNVTLDNGKLAISGQTQASKEYEEEGTKAKYRERVFASFSRSFNVPTGIKPEEIKGSFENGVLKVTFPKKVAEPEAKQVRIQ